ncbi:MAG: polyprenyl diphosphate synthase [Candidatus Aenigmarchaeota archaeon]|nr:polyprenyl diphosphate synthase [Candidatus Aenigmarchaeota archaeon]
MTIIITIPRHIGIIPDGNRRLARRLMQTPWKGHAMGLGKIRNVASWCNELGVKNVTIYLLSLENLQKRPKRELSYLFGLARGELKEILENAKHSVHLNRTRVRFFGRLEVLPADLQQGIRLVEEKTSHYANGFLNLAIAYGGRQEITEAVRKLARDAQKGRIKVGDIKESTLRNYMWTGELSDPDMVIRTGGEKRLSNFLPFQSTYSELFFMDKFWPELSKDDIAAAIKEYGERQRRFGK